MEQWYSGAEKQWNSGTVTVEPLEEWNSWNTVVQRNSGTEEHETILLKKSSVNCFRKKTYNCLAK